MTDPNRSTDAELAPLRSNANAAQACDASQAQLQTLFERAPLGVYLVDAELRISRVNPTAQGAFGEIPGLVGRDFAEVMHILWRPELADEIVERFRHTLRTGEPYVAPELVTERRDRGVVECYEWQIDRIPLPPGRDGVVCYFRDTSGRKRDEDAVRRAAEADAFRVALADTLRPLADPSRIQIEATRILGQHLQATRVFYCEVRIGQEDAVFARCFGDGDAHVVGPLRLDDYGPSNIRRLRAGQRVVVTDVQRDPMLTAEEKVMSTAVGVAASLCVPLVKGGRLAAFLGVSQSTPRCFTAGEVALVEETAERMWAAVERARGETALRESEERLRRADRHKDEFLATLSHELRNPLAPIRHALTVLEEVPEVSPEVSPEVHRLLQMMDRQVGNLVRMVDDLLEVSRISRGKIELRTELVDVRTIAESAIETSRPLIDAAEHRLLASLPPAPLMVMADPLRLSQVMANLLNNAAKYTNPGGRIWLTVGEDGRDVVISVRDDGVGIPSHMLPRIFEMFLQMDPDHKHAQGGLGIGLAVVHKLIEMHGGTVEARSEGPGKGSEIVVRLPRTWPMISATAGPVDEPAAEGEPCRARAHVLVVDDNADAAATLGMLLEAMGHDVRVVLDGPAALEAVRSQRPQVVLLDLGMPGMSGYEVAHHMRMDPACAGIMLVALTGWGQDEDRRRTQAAGFHHHLVKPVGLAALEELLATVSDRAGAR